MMNEISNTVQLSPSGEIVPNNPFTGPLISHLSRPDILGIYDHLISLPDTDRSRRFHSNINDTGIKNYVKNLDFTRMVFSGTFNKETGDIIGLAEGHFDKVHNAMSCEVTLSVSPGHRGHGLGTALLGHVLNTIRKCGIKKVVFYAEPHNRSMNRMLAMFRERKTLENGYTVLSLTQRDVVNFMNANEALLEQGIAA